MSKETGGPAFPQTMVDCGEPNGLVTNDELDNLGGMTLRDYFAAKALPVLCGKYVEAAEKVGLDEDWKAGIATDAYKIADAMLEARNK